MPGVYLFLMNLYCNEISNFNHLMMSNDPKMRYNENASKLIIIEKQLMMNFFAFLKIKEIEDMKKTLQANTTY